MYTHTSTSETIPRPEKILGQLLTEMFAVESGCTISNCPPSFCFIEFPYGKSKSYLERNAARLKRIVGLEYTDMPSSASSAMEGTRPKLRLEGGMENPVLLSIIEKVKVANKLSRLLTEMLGAKCTVNDSSGSIIFSANTAESALRHYADQLKGTLGLEYIVQLANNPSPSAYNHEPQPHELHIAVGVKLITIIERIEAAKRASVSSSDNLSGSMASDASSRESAKPTVPAAMLNQNQIPERLEALMIEEANDTLQKHTKISKVIRETVKKVLSQVAGTPIIISNTTYSPIIGLPMIGFSFQLDNNAHLGSLRDFFDTRFPGFVKEFHCDANNCLEMDVDSFMASHGTVIPALEVFLSDQRTNACTGTNQVKNETPVVMSMTPVASRPIEQYHLQSAISLLDKQTKAGLINCAERHIKFHNTFCEAIEKFLFETTSVPIKMGHNDYNGSLKINFSFQLVDNGQVYIETLYATLLRNFFDARFHGLVEQISYGTDNRFNMEINGTMVDSETMIPALESFLRDSSELYNHLSRLIIRAIREFWLSTFGAPMEANFCDDSSSKTLVIKFISQVDGRVIDPLLRNFFDMRFPGLIKQFNLSDDNSFDIKISDTIDFGIEIPRLSSFMCDCVHEVVSCDRNNFESLATGIGCDVTAERYGALCNALDNIIRDVFADECRYGDSEYRGAIQRQFEETQQRHEDLYCRNLHPIGLPPYICLYFAPIYHRDETLRQHLVYIRDRWVIELKHFFETKFPGLIKHIDKQHMIVDSSVAFNGTTIPALKAFICGDKVSVSAPLGSCAMFQPARSVSDSSAVTQVTDSTAGKNESSIIFQK